jgi:hypothetical protein
MTSLVREGARRRLAAQGLEQAFAASLQISPSLWSQIKSARPIGDKLARQIEKLARRASNRTGRKALRERLVFAVEAPAAAGRA